MRLYLIFAVLISNLTIGQSLKEELEGDWVCVGIYNSNGKHGFGKYGVSREYLRFSFKKNKLSISETPYDLGTVQNLLYDNVKRKIEIISDLQIEMPSDLPERYYDIKSLDNERLTLSTVNENNQLIDYEFILFYKFIIYQLVVFIYC